MQTNDLCKIELFKIELFDIFTVCKKKWLNDWIVSDSYQYLETFNFVDLCSIELLETELFDHLTAYLQNVFANHIFNVYIKTGFGVN